MNDESALSVETVETTIRPPHRRRLRHRRVQRPPLRLPAPVETSDAADAGREHLGSAITPAIDVTPLPTFEPTFDKQVWLSSAAEYAALEEAEQRAVQRAALLRKLFLYGGGVFIVVFSLVYLRMSGRLNRKELGLATPQASRSALKDPGVSFKPTTGASDGAEHATASTTPILPIAVAASHQKRDPAVAADLTVYATQDLQRVHQDEYRALVAFASVTGKHFRGPEPLFTALNTTVLPSYTRFVAEAEALHPKTAPVQALHRLFVQSAKAKLLSFQQIQQGEREPNGVWQVGARAEYEASVQMAAQFRQQANELAQAQGVKLP